VNDVSADVRALYAVEPEAFVAARDQLAKRLVADGDGDAAAAVKKLRKPTVAAWAIDRAARSQPELVEELLAAGERLTSAQRRAVSGARGTDDLRRAGDERRALIRRLTDLAARALEDAGRAGEHARDEIAGTFEAATLDPAVADQVRAGVLERTVRPSGGLGSLEGFTVVEGGAATSSAKKPSATAKREAEKAVAEAEKARAAADAAARRAEEAGAAAAEAARQAQERKAAALAAERESKRLAAEAKTAHARAQRAVRNLGT